MHFHFHSLNGLPACPSHWWQYVLVWPGSPWITLFAMPLIYICLLCKASWLQNPVLTYLFCTVFFFIFIILYEALDFRESQEYKHTSPSLPNLLQRLLGALALTQLQKRECFNLEDIWGNGAFSPTSPHGRLRATNNLKFKYKDYFGFYT